MKHLGALNGSANAPLWYKNAALGTGGKRRGYGVNRGAGLGKAFDNDLKKNGCQENERPREVPQQKHG